MADRNMITAYGDEHRRLRKLVAKAFTARRTAVLEPRIRALTEDLIADLADTVPGEAVDLRAGFAYPLPMRVISELLGITGDLRNDLLRCDAILDTTVSSETAKKNEIELSELLRKLVADKRRSPGEDLTSALLDTHDTEGGLSEQELLDTVLLMFTAGHETTVNLIDHAIFHMLTHPRFLPLVRRGELTWDHVIEETLRVEAPFGNLPLRYAVEDIDLGDVRIAKGETMTFSFAGAGRDRRVHGEDADRFDPFRATRAEHVSFGHGVHHCLGAPLARLESRIGLSRLFEEFPDMELGVPAEGIRPLESFISNGHRSLPVVLRPGVGNGEPRQKQEGKDR
ncbi:cytochrome P450 [Nocardiopsis sp. CNT312]|uniref:cytochrome P450 family protein n=1 Tax=Nocardiopsis sp. CNT312 TaxID=1137268 RepID=UPI0009DD43B0|nr:cytochrome P450 [Nocardiopsis sp. CNT312]